MKHTRSLRRAGASTLLASRSTWRKVKEHRADGERLPVKAINAISETAEERPVFRDAMRRRRCLAPADGFYEWQKLGTKEKQPYCFAMIDDLIGSRDIISFGLLASLPTWAGTLV
jgi:putative SOS response-associated peptidase YedK